MTFWVHGMNKFINYICDRLTEQLDIIENSSQGNLTEYQCGYIAGINYLLDLIINYKDSSEKNTSNENKPHIKPGFRLFAKRK